MLRLSPRVIVEPDDGLEPVREFINSAENSLLIKQFTFTEPTLDRGRDRSPAGRCRHTGPLNAQRSGGDRANDETYEQFQNAGMTAICMAIFIFTMLNPLLVVAAAGVIGYFGII
jgi:hypothetical protein